MRGRALTHVESDSDDVEAHSGVCDAAEGRGLAHRQASETVVHSETFTNLNTTFHACSLSLSCGDTYTLHTHTHSLLLPCHPPAVSHPVYFGHFVPPSAAFVSAHQLRGGALLC